MLVLDNLKFWPDGGAILKVRSQVTTLDPEEDMDICTKFNGNLYKSSQDISLKNTSVNLTLEDKSENHHSH